MSKAKERTCTQVDNTVKVEVKCFLLSAALFQFMSKLGNNFKMFSFHSKFCGRSKTKRQLGIIDVN